MGGGLLTPAFLAGLLALAVPVALHLVRAEELRGRGFPSLMFLRRIPVPTRRRRQLRDRGLLALRCLALALLAVAFARPLPAPGGTGPGPGDGGRDTVVLVDVSYGMGDGERFEAARAVARRAVEGGGAGGRTALVAFDDAPVLLAGFEDPPESARAALDALRPGSGGTDFSRALAEAERLLADSRRARRVVLVSDLQIAGLPPGGRLRLDAGIELELGAVGGGGANVAVIDVRTRPAPGERIGIAARIRNGGAAALPELPLTLEVDDRAVETRLVSLEAGAERVVDFVLPARPERPARVRVRLPTGVVESDAIALDNRRDLVLGPVRPLAVVLVEPAGGPSRSRLFLTEALALASEPPNEVRVVAADTLAAGDLAGADVVILDDVPVPAGAAGAALSARVAGGAGLLVVAGDRGGSSSAAGAPDLLPGRAGAIVERAGDGGRLGSIERAHPLGSAASGDPGETPVHRYRSFEPGPESRIVARYDDGGAAIVERDVGPGRVMVLTTGLDPRWSGLALQRAFVPLVHAAVRHLAGRVIAAPAFVVRDVVDIGRYAAGLGGANTFAAHVAAGGAVIVESPSGVPIHRPGQGAGLRAGGASRIIALGEPGFHVLHATGGRDDSVPLAVNVDASESDLAALDADAFLARIDRPATPAPRRDEGARSGREPDDTAWRVLLALALAVLVAESLLSRRITRRRAAFAGVT